MPAAAPAPMTSLLLKVSCPESFLVMTNAADGVGGALEKAALAHGVVAVVLVREYGADGFDGEVLDGLIDIAMPEVSTVAGSALVKFGG